VKAGLDPFLRKSKLGLNPGDASTFASNSIIFPLNFNHSDLTLYLGL
jgi:hypothetical protein